MLGLDGAGATTILYQLALGKRFDTIPTLGVNHEIISANGLRLDCWDIGGLDKMRPLWAQYSRDADAIVFVIDATDSERMELAAHELHSLYAHDSNDASIHDRPLLIFANKQDKGGALGAADVGTNLKVPELGVKTFSIFKSSADDKDSLWAGINWLAEHLKSRTAIQPSQK